MSGPAEIETESSLQSLNEGFRQLEAELCALQSKYEGLSSHHGNLCSIGVQDALSSLFQMIRYVNKADTSLIEWHGRSKGLKKALRLIGVDRRTDVMVEKKTLKIKAKVSKVEAKVDKAEGTVSDGLNSMASLSNQIVNFSVTSVDHVSEQAMEARSRYNRASKIISVNIDTQSRRDEEAKNDAAEVESSIRELKSQQDSTRLRRDLSAGATLLGGAATLASIVGAFVFLPSAVLTAPLLAATTASAINGGEHQAALTKLESEEATLNAELAESQAKLAVLNQQLASLKGKHSDLVAATAEAEALQGKTGSLRVEAQAILDDLRAVRVMLTDVKSKLKAVSRELHECGYAETRREIAVRLRGTLVLIQGVGTKRNMRLKDSAVQEAMKALVGMSQKTPQVMCIIDAQRIARPQVGQELVA